MDSPATEHSADTSHAHARPADNPTPAVPPVVGGDSPYAVPAGESGTAAGLSVGNPVYSIVIPLVIVAVGLVAFLAFGKRQPPEKPPEDMTLAARLARLPEVQVLPVRSLSAVGNTLDLGVDGTVVPYREVEIATQVAGQIVYKDPLCEVGSFVEAGQLLIRIDPTDYKNEVARLKQQKEQEYQTLRELDQETANTNRLLQVAEQEVELREREVARLKALPDGFASPAELDAAQRSRLQAVNNRVTLENQLAAMRQRRNRLEAAERLAETQLEMAETNLGRTEIRAPVSGVIYREDAELNSFVQRGQVVVTVEDTDKAEVVINLRPDQLYWVLNQGSPNAEGENQAQSSAAVDVSRRSYQLPPTTAWVYYQVAGRESERYRWQGSLQTYDGIGVDPTSRTVPVRVTVDTPSSYQVVNQNDQPIDASTAPLALVRGMFVSVVLEINPRKSLLVIPGVALKPGNQGNRVWKFQPAPNLLRDDPKTEKPQTPPASEAGENSNSGDADGSGPDKPGDEDAADDAENQPEDAEEKLDPDKWLVGRIEVIRQVRPVESTKLFQTAEDGELAVDSSGKSSYWICEAGEGGLQPGDQLIVTPLASFEGKGQDLARWKLPESEDPKADRADKASGSTSAQK